MPMEWSGLFIAPLFTLPFVWATWLLALVPLYFLVPRQSVLWTWPLCTAYGTIAGAAIISIFDIHYFLRDPLNAYTIFAPIIGGTTCLFGSLTRERFSIRQ